MLKSKYTYSKIFRASFGIIENDLLEHDKTESSEHVHSTISVSEHFGDVQLVMMLL